MLSLWQTLTGNLAVVALFVLGWANLRFWLRNLPRAVRAVLFGLAMGLGSATTMVLADQVMPGYFLDLRMSLVALAGFFGGPLALAITLCIALPARLLLEGGGLLVGLGSILASALAGLGLRLMVRRGTTKAWHGFLLGGFTGLISVVGLVIMGGSDLPVALLPLALLNVLTTGLASIIFLQTRRFTAGADLLAAGVTRAPDYFYVKDRHGRFVATNETVARFYGLVSPRELIGKTDPELDPSERARDMFADEQAMMAREGSQTEVDERVIVTVAGTERWLATSRVALRTGTGELIGMVGVTKDVTEDRKLRQDLIDSRNALSYALAEMSDGLAMFDSDGRILLCNEQYRASFPYTRHLRKPGALLRDILREVVWTGEQLNVPSADPEGWINLIVSNLDRETEEEVNLFDGRWLQVRTRPTSEAKTLVVITDVTRIKLAELKLKSATDQLTQLVRTDWLTGLLNRRAFDDCMDREIDRSSRDGCR